MLVSLSFWTQIREVLPSGLTSRLVFVIILIIIAIFVLIKNIKYYVDTKLCCVRGYILLCACRSDMALSSLSAAR